MKNAKAILVVVAVVLVGWMAGTARADFVKMGSEHLDVTTSHTTGILYENSTADVLAGGYIDHAYVNDNALLTVQRPNGTAIYYARLYNNGRMQVLDGAFQEVHPYDSSTVAISGGSVTLLYAHDSSTVNISGGNVTYHLYPSGASTVNISGGNVTDLRLGTGLNTSTTTFYGYDFRATAGLSLLEFDVIDGVPQYEVIGTGLLTGKWRDGTTWITEISTNYSRGNETILAVPEPATLSLLALGGLGMLRRRRRV